MAFKIIMFSDFICPFCYIGFEVMRQLKPEFDFELEWRGFQIHPDWPAKGVSPEQIHGMGDRDARNAAWQRITAMADEVGLEMRPPAMLTNSRVALAVAEFAREQGIDAAFEARVYRAYFGDGANIGDTEVVARLGEESGLDRAAVAAAIDSPKYDLKLKNHALVAHQRGVSGVPTFFFGEYPLVGAQPLAVMRKVLTRASERFGNGKPGA
ncbi:MAG TPA: DsbA family oxidoreductase [Candidatus Binataceae bacterium]